MQSFHVIASVANQSGHSSDKFVIAKLLHPHPYKKIHKQTQTFDGGMLVIYTDNMNWGNYEKIFCYNNFTINRNTYFGGHYQSEFDA